MNATGRDACRQLFLRLVTLGEGTEDTRRRVRRSELATLADPQTMDARHRDVRPPPAALVRSRSRHARADGRDRARGPAPRVGAPARLDRRRAGGPAPAREDLVRDAANGAGRSKLRLPAVGDPARAGRGGDARTTRSGSRTTNASTSTRASPTETPEREAERDAPRAGAHPRAPRPHPPSRPRRRAGAALVLAASLTAVSVSRSREAERRRDESTIAALTGGVALEPQHRSRDSACSSRCTREPQRLDRRTRSGRDGRGAALGDAGGRRSSTRCRAAPTTVVARTARGQGSLRPTAPELAKAARGGITRSLTPARMRALLRTPSCPPLPRDVPARPRGGSRRADPAPAGPAAGRHPGHALRRKRPGPGGGLRARVRVVHRRDRASRSASSGTRFSTTTSPRASQAGDPPDVAVVPQPGIVRDLAREGHLIDLGTYLDLEALKSDQSPYLVSLGTIGDDGSWPASDGATYGAFVSVNLKSMIWYPVPELASRGLRDPTDVGRAHRAERSAGARRPHAVVHGVGSGSRSGGPGPTGSSTCC